MIEGQGLFCSLYTDRGSHYWTTPEAGGKGQTRSTWPSLGGPWESGIEMIPACSPEARGRSERVFSTHQDRLVKALALAGITELEAATTTLTGTCLPAYNAEFTQPPPEQGSAFVACRDVSVLDDILCERFERTVRKDNCVHFEGRYPGGSSSLPLCEGEGPGSALYRWVPGDSPRSPGAGKV